MKQTSVAQRFSSTSHPRTRLAMWIAVPQPPGRSKSSIASVPKMVAEDLHVSVPLESHQPEHPHASMQVRHCSVCLGGQGLR